MALCFARFRASSLTTTPDWKKRVSGRKLQLIARSAREEMKASNPVKVSVSSLIRSMPYASIDMPLQHAPERHPSETPNQRVMSLVPGVTHISIVHMQRHNVTRVFPVFEQFFDLIPVFEQFLVRFGAKRCVTAKRRERRKAATNNHRRHPLHLTKPCATLCHSRAIEQFHA